MEARRQPPSQVAAPPCGDALWPEAAEANGNRRALLNALFFYGAIKSTGSINKRTEDEAMDYSHGR